MKRRVSALLFLALGILSALPARGALLSQRSISINRNRNIFTTSDFKLEVEFGDTLFFNTGTIDVAFDDLAITPASVGQTFQSTLSNDAKFDEAALRMTNALNQAIRFAMTESSSNRPEKLTYAENSVLNRPVSTPDFAGKIITMMELRIDAFKLDFSPTEPAPGERRVDLQFTFSVYGFSIPEPGTLSIALGGLAMLAARGYSGRRSYCLGARR